MFETFEVEKCRAISGHSP